MVVRVKYFSNNPCYQDYHSFQLTAGFERSFHATTRALDVFTLHERLLLDIYHFRLPSNARDLLPSNTPCLSNDRQKLRPRLTTVHSPFHAAADTFAHCRHWSVSRAADNRPGIEYTSAKRTCLGYDNQTPNFPFIRPCQSDSSRVTVPRSAYIAQTNEWPVKDARKRIDGNERARKTQRIDKTNA